MALSKITNASVADTAVHGRRNLIINGNFAIDQRNSGSSITPTNGQFSADRWKCSLSQASKFSAQQVTDAPVGFQNSIKITSLSAYTPVSSDYFLVQQQLEGYTGAHLLYGTADAKTATLSFYVKSSLTGTFGGAIRNSNGYNRAYPFEYTINSANTWERKTITFAGDTSGTYLTTNGAGITTTFSVGAGANFKSTANAWAADNDIAGSNATDVVATNNATWQITGVQLEVGEQATPFEHRSYHDEAQRCKRYYEVLTNYVYSTAYSNQSLGNFWFTVEKRTNCTLTADTNAGGLDLTWSPAGSGNTHGGYIYENPAGWSAVGGIRGDAEL